MKRTSIALLVAGFSWLASPTAARADLDPGFAAVIQVDTTWLTGANGVTDLEFASNGRAIVITKSGTVWIRAADGTRRQRTGLFPAIDTTNDKGLLGIVADPRAPDSFFFYVSNGPTEDKHRVYRGTLGADDTITIDTTTPVLAESRGLGPGLRGPANHDGGGMVVYDGFLYIGVGDTGNNASPPLNKFASCLNNGNGKILRLKLDGSIPADNPLVNVAAVTGCANTSSMGQRSAFVDDATPDRRIYAWGLRNPWRFWVDPQTGLLWIGDVGEIMREEVSVGRTGHYGYPFHEGLYDWSRTGNALRLEKDCDQGFLPAQTCIQPVLDYQHLTTNGSNDSSITGGLIPAGCGWSNAFGGKQYYLFGDYNRNFIRAAEVNATRTGVTGAPLNFGTFNAPVSFKQGPDGGVYVAMYSSSAVYRFAPRETTGPDCAAGGSSGGTGGVGAGGIGIGGATAGASVGGGAEASGGAASGSSSGPASGSSSAGTGGGSGGGTTASGGASASSGGGTSTSGPSATGGAAPATSPAGCGCRAAPDRERSTTLAVALALLSLTFVRRRSSSHPKRRA